MREPPTLEPYVELREVPKMPEKRTSRKSKAKGDPGFEAVEGMSEDARRLREQAGNPLMTLADTIRGLIASEVDPYLLSGILLEGVAQVVAARIPANRQADTVMATITLLEQRLKACGDSPARPHSCDTTSSGNP
jgi:hypothetical protein